MHPSSLPLAVTLSLAFGALANAEVIAPAIVGAGLHSAVGVAAPAAAQAGQAGEAPDMTQLFARVNAVAEQLQTNLTDLEASIQASRDSVEKGAEVLDGMLASVRSVNASLAEDSEIWHELDALLGLWEERRKDTLAKSETNPAFLPIAQSWQSKLDTARELRNQISTERANSLALARAIEADRDIVLAYYELGQADKAIENLQRVSANLVDLNRNMQQIVQTADAARQPPIPQ